MESFSHLTILTGDPFTTPNPKCSCRKCNINAWWMITCKTCGNKRCPKAENHEFKCFNSNELNQQKILDSSDKNL
jgi:hypothetical protein